MSKVHRNVPKLRFPGFDEAWEQRKYSDLATIRRGLTYKPESIVNGGKRVLRSSNINEDSFVIHEDDVFVDEAAVNIPYAKNGDILITSANGSSRLVGKHAIIRDIADNSVVHGGFMLLASSEEPEFVNALMSSQWYLKFIGMYVAGGNGAIGNLNKNDLDEQIVSVPKIEEQRRIGKFFGNFDTLISLQQRKLDQIKEYKKGMLQKMFPKEGETMPEVRFPGFTGEWEHRKLGDVANEFKSGSFIAASDINESGTYPVYGGNGLRGYAEAFNHDGEFALIGRQGALCGNMNYSIGKAYFTEHAVAVKANEQSDTLFLYYLLGNMNLGQYSDQSAQPGLAVGKLIKLQNLFPTKNEQAKIASFFKNLDTLISLHQRKLDAMKEYKKGLLQQMFV